MKRNDLTGQIFSRWSVLSYDKISSKYECICSCGTKRHVLGKSLQRGTSKSCGCIQKEQKKLNAIKVSKICYNCGKSFLCPSYREKLAKYCSKECVKNGKYITKKCKECNTDFTTRVCQLKDFCSRLCSGKSNGRKRKLKTKTTEFNCIECNKQFFVQSCMVKVREKKCAVKYCSLACYHANVKKEIPCLFCGTLFRKNRNSRKFCSTNCFNEFKKVKTRENPGRWKENGYVVIYDGDGKGIKEHIKIMQDYIGEKIDTSKYHVHHINGIRDDNRIDNLQLMTKGEHSRLHRLEENKKGNLFGRNKKSYKNHLKSLNVEYPEVEIEEK